MSSVSLYRKYRSQKFADLAGQDHVTRTLQNAIRTGRVAHAYLFCGPRGTGKTSTARLLAKALKCDQGPTPEPCDECPACEEIRTGTSLDVMEIDAASHRGIDDVRAIRDQVAYHAVRGQYRIYVIDEVHMLTGEAFNALLKTLEEPPEHVIFILATTEAHKIPATILSRCQKFVFRRASHEQLTQRMAEVANAEGIEVDATALSLLARHATGSWRDALGLLEQVTAFTGGPVTAAEVRTVLGLVDAEALDDIVAAIAAGDCARLFGLVADALEGSRDPRQILADLTDIFRDLLLASAGARVETSDEGQVRLKQQAGQFSLAQLTRAVELLGAAERDLRWSQQTRLLLEILLVRLAQGEGSPPRTRPVPAPETAVTKPSPQRASGTVAAPSSVPGATRSAAKSVTQRPPPVPTADARVVSEGGPKVNDARGTPEADPWDDLEASEPAGGSFQGPEPPVADRELAEGNPGLHAVRRNWKLIAEELKRRRKMMLQALLVDATPAEFVNGELVIEHPYPINAERLEQLHAKDPQALGSVIRDLAGVECRVRIRVKGAAATLSTAPASPAPGVIDRSQGDAQGESSIPVSPPAGAQRQLIHEVVDIFDGKIVDGDLKT